VSLQMRKIIKDAILAWKIPTEVIEHETCLKRDELLLQQEEEEEGEEKENPKKLGASSGRPEKRKRQPEKDDIVHILDNSPRKAYKSSDVVPERKNGEEKRTGTRGRATGGRATGGRGGRKR